MAYQEMRAREVGVEDVERCFKGWVEGEGGDGRGEGGRVGFARWEERGRVGEEMGVEGGKGGEAGIGLVCHSGSWLFQRFRGWM